ncbi:uncharacterized protein LOC114277117 [Camellia sinensis]|uniref:uncharacterized protein LOC114277117 n=1 Tax=Camellia sinensis TaxID=4442 RepID=UPI001036BE98|nr:uncharacterized protein LOC114277117 [Camellia sinensis]
MKQLNEFIDACELNDLPLYGRKYTWCNAQEAYKWSRIDRVLLSPEWLIHFNMKLWGLPRLISDHCPLLLMEDERNWGPKPFRFINVWTLHPSFSHLFTTCWKNSNFVGWVGFIIQQKLKYLKLELKKWNSEVFGNASSRLKATEDELHTLDITAMARDLLVSEKDIRREVRGEVWKLYRRVEWLWHQQFRLNCSLQGDKNTRYFHVITSTRQSRNMINSISLNGVSYEEPSRVKHEVILHFRNQFKESWVNRLVLDGDFKSIEGNSVSLHLVSDFTEAEVLETIKESTGNEAPGANGITYGINSSFITLISKLVNPINLSNYRPISLVGSLYKILAKVLVHRMKPIMPSIIGETQTAFIGGRNIIDRVFIANEVADDWKKAK